MSEIEIQTKNVPNGNSDEDSSASNAINNSPEWILVKDRKSKKNTGIQNRNNASLHGPERNRNTSNRDPNNVDLGSDLKNIPQTVLYVDDYVKKSTLLNLLRVSKFKPSAECLTIIFVHQAWRAEDLRVYLAQRGYSTTGFGGFTRLLEGSLMNFKSGITPIIVDTTRAMKIEIDCEFKIIPNVKHVINFDLPSDIYEYVYRIGRAGNGGVSTSFFSERNFPLKGRLTKVLREAKQNIPPFLKYNRKKKSD